MIRSLFLGACALALSAEVSTAQSLTPRYRQVSGVELFANPFASTYACRISENARRHFNYDSEHGGALVIGVRKGSPAEKAGLQCRDVIIAVNGSPIAGFEDMQEHTNVAPGELIEVTYLSPVRPDDTSMDVEYHEVPKKATIGTMTLDEVEEAKRRAPAETNMNIADVFGPKFVFDARSTFSEISPGVIRYEIALMHNGDQEVLPIESVALPYLGIMDMYPEIPRGGQRLITVDAAIEDSGIPVLSIVPLHVARRIDQSGDPRRRFRKVPYTSVRVVQGVGGSEVNWYSWVRVNIRVFLPEKLARDLRSKQVRLDGLKD